MIVTRGEKRKEVNLIHGRQIINLTIAETIKLQADISEHLQMLYKDGDLRPEKSFDSAWVDAEKKTKGEKNGICSRKTCHNDINVVFFNTRNREFYCPLCASGINLACKESGEREICEEHLVH